MSAAGVRESRRRLVLMSGALASPMLLLVVAAAVVLGLKAAHQGARWTVVNRSCPQLGALPAGVLLVDADPLVDRGIDTLSVRDCHYSGAGGDLVVGVSLYRGSVLHSSHGEAVRAFGRNPPAGFRAIGAQGDDGRHFGEAGSGRLVLSSVVDNAEVRVLYRPAEGAELAAFRDPLQVVADQTVVRLG